MLKLPYPVLACGPMVGQSDLPFRRMVRAHGANVVYTQMIEARRFLADESYAVDVFDCHRGDGGPGDRFLAAQIAGNTASELLACAKLLEPHCDAIDFNLGCPQERARAGNYGAYLLEKKHWDLVADIVRTLSDGLKVPVWCKIRLAPGVGVEGTVKLAKLLEEAGCKLLAVHARYPSATRRRCGAADLNAVRDIKKNVNIPVISNGNVRCYEDIQANLDYTGADGIMVVEAILENPWMFSAKAPMSAEQLIREYFNFCLKEADIRSVSIPAVQQHVRHFLVTCQASKNADFKKALTTANTLEKVWSVLLEFSFVKEEPVFF